MRRAAKIDTNQTDIVQWLRRNGCNVLHLHTLKNCCDLLVGYKGKLYLFEVKDGNKPESQRKLTKGEQKFFDDWKGYPLHVVTNYFDCAEILEIDMF